MGNEGSTSTQNYEFDSELYKKITNFICEKGNSEDINKPVQLITCNQSNYDIEYLRSVITNINLTLLSKISLINNANIFTSTLTNSLTENDQEDNGIESEDLHISNQIKIICNKIEGLNMNTEENLIKNESFIMQDETIDQKKSNELEVIKENSINLTSNLALELTVQKSLTEISKDFGSNKKEDIQKNYSNEQISRIQKICNEFFENDYFSFENFMKKETEKLSQKYGKDLKNLRVCENIKRNIQTTQNQSKIQRSVLENSARSAARSPTKGTSLQKKNTFSREKIVLYNKKILKRNNTKKQDQINTNAVEKSIFSTNIKLNISNDSTKIGINRSPKSKKGFGSPKVAYNNQSEIKAKPLIKIDIQDIRKISKNPKKRNNSNSDISVMASKKFNKETQSTNTNSPKRVNRSLNKTVQSSLAKKRIEYNKSEVKSNLPSEQNNPIFSLRIVNNKLIESDRNKVHLFKQEKEIPNQPVRHTLKIDLKSLLDEDEKESNLTIGDMGIGSSNENLYHESNNVKKDFFVQKTTKEGSKFSIYKNQKGYQKGNWN